MELKRENTIFNRWKATKGGEGKIQIFGFVIHIRISDIIIKEGMVIIVETTGKTIEK